MKINGNINSRTGAWKSVQSHVDRDYKDDDNKASIDSKYTKYNLGGVACNVSGVLHRHYDKWLHDHNAKMKKQGRFSRVKTFKGLVNKTSGKVVTNRQVMTFGTKADKHLQLSLISKDYPNLSSGQVKRRYFQAVSRGLKRYAIHYNERNKFVPMGHYMTNVEEKGAPHLHCAVIPLGFTKKGKPSSSLSSALKRQFHTKSRSRAMSDWSRQEDEALVHDVGATLALRFQKVPEFKKWKLQHTHAPQHQNEVEYKRTVTEQALARERKEFLHQKKLSKRRLVRRSKRIEKQRHIAEHKSRVYNDKLRKDTERQAEQVNQLADSKLRKANEKEDRADKLFDKATDKMNKAETMIRAAWQCEHEFHNEVKSFENKLTKRLTRWRDKVQNSVENTFKNGFSAFKKTADDFHKGKFGTYSPSDKAHDEASKLSNKSISKVFAKVKKNQSIKSSKLRITRPSLNTGTSQTKQTEIRNLERENDPDNPNL